MSKTLKLDNKHFILPKINLIYKDLFVNSNINLSEYNNLISYKDKIDELNDHKTWDKSKKLSNDYELIYLPNKKMKCKSIAQYDPLSRSYFKLWEMIKDFNLVGEKNEYTMAGIAEGPGGFIEAFVNYRKKYFNTQDDVFGITLKSTNKDIPGWKKTKTFLNENPQITISYGKDNTGNLYNLDNIFEFIKLVEPHTIDLVTADGGFDFSIDFNKQEILAYRMIFCEVVTALAVQKKGGTFICKIFDIYTEITIQFIYLLGFFYEEIYITKPYTSRPANSEKYLICKNFKGIDKSYLDDLLKIVKKWEIIENINYHIHSIFDIEKNHILDQIIKYNNINSDLQIENIVKTLDIIKNKSDPNLYNKIIKNQTQKALEWCKFYDLDINHKSDFLK